MRVETLYNLPLPLTPSHQWRENLFVSCRQWRENIVSSPSTGDYNLPLLSLDGRLQPIYPLPRRERIKVRVETLYNLPLPLTPSHQGREHIIDFLTPGEGEYY